jgi:serine/threonine protein kinase
MTDSGKVVSLHIAETVLQHMLQALDFLHRHSRIVHRDVRPSNIICLQSDGKWRFYLANFALAHSIDSQTQAGTLPSFLGTPLYMAPENFYEGKWDWAQISKMDVWSLYVTILWILDIGQFRHLYSQHGAQAAIFLASKADVVSKLKEMAISKPSLRASAAQMIGKLYST